MEWVKIDGRTYDVHVDEITRTFTIKQSQNSGATIGIGAPEILDPLGTYIGHTIRFRAKPGQEHELEKLWEYVLQPRYRGVMVDIVYGQGTLKYEAKITTGTQPLKRIDPETNKVYWGVFSLNIVPTKAQVTP
jgi:hypothetical protein